MVDQGEGDVTRQPGETPIRSLTFIVRVSENESGGLTGVVEHARTGRKERFEQLESIGRVIAALLSRTDPAKGDATAL
jgi:hypothetical protein